MLFKLDETPEDEPLKPVSKTPVANKGKKAGSSSNKLKKKARPAIVDEDEERKDFQDDITS